jgi:hypothetical protein
MSVCDGCSSPPIARHCKIIHLRKELLVGELIQEEYPKPINVRPLIVEEPLLWDYKGEE